MIGLVLIATYGLPAIGIVFPSIVSIVLFLVFIPAGCVGLWKILNFQGYREINQQLLAQLNNQMDSAKQAVKKSTEKTISTDTSITSKRKGFEYLNELFIKRHQKILWKATKKITFVCTVLVCVGLLVLYLAPEAKDKVNKLILNWLPYFTFIMYAINRGTGFTRALFMNCDHSLLTYSFYKQPGFILKLFRIRLREIMKINVVPALVIGAGLPLLLYASGGTDNPLNYIVLFVSILSMSLFFSIHYLTIYYLLQPYNAGSEMKSGTYQIIMSVTYFVCFVMMQVQMPILVFGIACIIFCMGAQCFQTALHCLDSQIPVWSNFDGQLREILFPQSFQQIRRQFSLHQSTVQSFLCLRSREADIYIQFALAVVPNSHINRTRAVAIG